jgi:protein MpaA
MKMNKLSFLFALSLMSFLSGAFAAPSVPVASPSPVGIKQWCDEVQSSIAKFKWRLDACKDISWKNEMTSIEGRPLVYAEFGDPKAKNVTLVFTMVHGDEITPLYLGLQLARWLEQNQKNMGGTRVVIAPLVNPDGFFRKPRRRMNANGVDINRNFDTRDWQAKALRAWKMKFHGDPRRNPGNEPKSEPETVFQEDLIKRLKPQKIISIHAPLNFLDYDGPSTMSLDRFPKEYVQNCLQLRKQVKAISSGFFPGSLGNYAGQELGIPTLTLELPTADPHKAELYWKKFSEGIRVAIDYVIEPHAATGM